MQPGIHWCSPLFSTGCSQKFIGAIQCPSTGCSQDLMGQNCKRRVHFIGTSLFLFFNDIGHSRGFHKNYSPWLVNTLGTAGIFQEKVPNSSSEHGEHFVEICRLCPNRPSSRKIRGEQFFISTSLCPKPINLWGTIPVKLAPVPKPTHRPGNPRGTLLKKSLLCPNTHARRPAPP